MDVAVVTAACHAASLRSTGPGPAAGAREVKRRIMVGGGLLAYRLVERLLAPIRAG
jgi:hypothetical protein